jgi:hypothetical protein
MIFSSANAALPTLTSSKVVRGYRSAATTDNGCVGRKIMPEIFPSPLVDPQYVLYSRRCIASTVGIFQDVTKDGCFWAFLPPARMEILPSLFENPRAISGQPWASKPNDIPDWDTIQGSRDRASHSFASRGLRQLLHTLS